MINLYKKDSKGDILVWQITTVTNDITIQAGRLNGKLAETRRYITEGKNIGKANETSIKDQIQLEIDSLIKRKRRQGYRSLEDLQKTCSIDIFDSVWNTPAGERNIYLENFLKKELSKNSTDLDGNLKPMKCQQYFRSKPNWTDPTGKVWKDRKYYYLLNPNVEKEANAIIIKFPCLIQPKINGVRATVSLDDTGNIQILSKEGLKYNIPHIENDFKHLPFIYQYNGKDYDLIYDGELYIHGQPLQEIVSAVKSNNMFSNNIVYKSFDLIIPELNNMARAVLLRKIFNDIVLGNIEKVPCGKISDDILVQEMTDMYISQGYEGSILRDPNALYQPGKRPMTMVKLKRIISKEFKIIDIIPQDKNPELGMYQCITEDGEYFNVTATLSNIEKESLILNKQWYINKMLTCEFYEYTDKGIPFHIINNIIRDYE